MAVYNAVRGVDKAMRFYEMPTKEKEDVTMELVELESVGYGQPYKARILLEVRAWICKEKRCAANPSQNVCGVGLGVVYVKDWTFRIKCN